MLPITTTYNINLLQLHLLKLWGNILSTTATTIPISYFLQDVQIFSQNNNSDSAINASSGVDTTSILPEKPHQTLKSLRLLYGLNDEVEIFAHGLSSASESDSDGGSCAGLAGVEGSDGEEEKLLKAGKQSKKKCRIQRMRYGREEYKCPNCPYRCTTEHAFVRHHRTTCDTTTPPHQQQRNDDQPQHPQDDDCNRTVGRVTVSCCVCGMDRSGERSLALHMQRHRTGKYFQCDLCRFQTLQLKKLIQHRRMHTGEKPHLCPHCPYRSARRDNLRSHVRRVHKKDNLLEDTFTPSCLVAIPRNFNTLHNSSYTVHTH